MVKIFVPQGQIVDRRQQAGGAHCVEVRDADQKGILGGLISIGDIFDDLGVVVAKPRIVHLQRLKDVGGREFAKGLSTHPLHYLSQQGVARVAVQVSGAGRKIQVPLARHNSQDVVVGDQVKRVTPT